jgi:23S rRNA pseudouridine2605 synthase
MRINKFIAASSSLSRRAADAAIAAGKVTVNGQPAEQGQEISPTDVVALEGRVLTAPVSTTTIILNKPVGFVVSRQGQGSRTIYDLLPPEYQQLNPVGRLDKDSSGLLLLTNDGQLAQELTHPSRQKTKIYEVTLDKPLAPLHQQMISDHGISLDDGPSKFAITKLDPVRSTATPPRGAREGGLLSSEAPKAPEEGLSPPKNGNSDFHLKIGNEKSSSPIYEITMREGRNRQIRRTFAALGYTVVTLHRTHFGPYQLGELARGKITEIK